MTWPMPYVAATIGGIEIHDPTNGVVQHDPVDHALGMVPAPIITGGGGQHGAIAGRMVFKPGIVTLPVSVFATDGTTQQAREISYRNNLDRLRLAISSSDLRCDITYGDGDVRRSNVAVQEWIRRDPILWGFKWDIPLLILRAWRATADIEQTWGTVYGGSALTDPIELTMTGWAGSTAAITDLKVLITGASDEFTIGPLDDRVGTSVPWVMRYNLAIPSPETVTLFTDPDVAEITSTDPGLVDYSVWSHPGNPSYILEVPAGVAGAAPRIKVWGAPAGLKLTGRPRWLSL